MKKTLTPYSTYRIQLHSKSTFSDLKKWIVYLDHLGIDWVYVSPISKAHKGSLHGYDTVDFHTLNSELGTDQELQDLITALHESKRGLLIDFAPNHMSLSIEENAWLQDVLEKGPHSHYYDFFDIHWKGVENKLLLPILASSCKEALKNKEIRFIRNKLTVGGVKLPFCIGQKGEKSNLESLLQNQFYRLCTWDEGRTLLNYRRFADISSLIALNVQKVKVYQAVHEWIFTLYKKGWVDGLRIDHIDGLSDPEKYLRVLKKDMPQAFIVVEKVLTGEEPLPSKWKIEGTVGYDALNQINHVFIDSSHKEVFKAIYESFIGYSVNVEDLIFDSKKQVLLDSFSSDLNRLIELMGHPALQEALIALLCSFPVYRTYIQNTPQDREYLHRAYSRALKRTDQKLLDELMAIFNSRKKREFIIRFQQLTAELMAKGYEDTALYRYYPLASINEVGSQLDQFGIPIETFHQLNRERQKKWPHSLIATSTHDTKRGEDVRARLNVLSEIPNDWKKILMKLHKICHALKHAVGPSLNEEYSIYQTLIGTWPFEKIDSEYIQRIQTYLIKMLREAKVNTHWGQPDAAYESSVTSFIEALLTHAPFLEEMKVIMPPIIQAGLYNALSQVVLKIAMPGVADFYQGCEKWNFSLVDPDNRRPVDFQHSHTLFQSLQEPFYFECLEDEKTKIYVTHKALQLRRKQYALWNKGEYIPIDTKGTYRSHLVAFKRQHEDETGIAIIGRHFMPFIKKGKEPLGQVWKDTHVALSPGTYRDVFSDRIYSVQESLSLKDLFVLFPFSLLERLTP